MTKRTESDENARLRQLVDAVIDGTATASEHGELDEWLQVDAEARRYYRNVSHIHAELRWMHRANEPSVAAKSTPPPTPLTEETWIETPAKIVRPIGKVRGRNEAAPTLAHSRVAWSAGRVRFAKAAMLSGLLATLAAALFYRSVARHGEPQSSKALVVAELRSDEGCTWSQQPIAMGSELHAGQKMELTAGVARLRFLGGATVLVESPAKFELVSATSLRLERGNLAVRANGPVKEFTVISPEASVVDRGTSFAVHCGENGATEVEVLEGAVEVVPERGPQNRRVLEMGTSGRVSREGNSVALATTQPEDYQFAALIERLWSDIRVAAPDNAGVADSHSVEANFSDVAGPKAVDTFYAAKPGLGWLTPWVASGNPTGKIRRDDPGFGPGNPYLNMRFKRSFERAIAREYGSRPGFDPTEPHVISWRWRLEGKASHFDDNFRDRATFYGNPYFRRGSWPTNSWLIGVVGDDEARDQVGVSTQWLKRQHRSAADEIEERSTNTRRRAYPKRWYFFDGQREGVAGAVFDRSNMVDTGMKIKFGVIYHFAVAVYPQEARYDAAIRDDEQTVVRTGLSFRSREVVPANVLHFSVNVNRSNENLAFSLDSVRIQPLTSGGIEQQLESPSGP